LSSQLPSLGLSIAEIHELTLSAHGSIGQLGSLITIKFYQLQQTPVVLPIVDEPQTFFDRHP